MRFDLSGSGLRPVLLLWVVFVGTFTLGFLPAPAQAAGKRLSKQDVIDLLTGDVPSQRVAAIAQDRGVAFEMTTATEKDIRAAGGSDDLIKTLRALAPHAPAAPKLPPRTTAANTSPTVLLIQSTPGESQVYVDDEPMGSTSHEGRLKLTRVAPGAHHVRIARDGYQDHEQDVTVTNGETTTVVAALHQPPAAPPEQHAAQTNTIPEGGPGFLGVGAMEQQPAGAQGVVIARITPGGPADTAGMKTNDAIVAVDGRAVKTPQELKAAVANHRAGDSVAITWYNGSSRITRQVQLTQPPAQAQTVPPVNNPAQAQTVPQVNNPALNPPPHNGLATFIVAHDHGQSGKDYCLGVMAIGNGMIYYKSSNGVHNFEIPLSSVREAKRNAVYLSAMGAFHIRQGNGTNYNFVVLNAQKQFQSPDPLLLAIGQAMGR